MKIKYQIVEVWPEDHLIVVRYYTDRLPPESPVLDPRYDETGKLVRTRADWSLELPVPTPRGEELHKFIMRNAPVDFFDLRQRIADGDEATNMDHVVELLNKEFSGEATPTRLRETPAPPEELTVTML